MQMISYTLHTLSSTPQLCVRFFALVIEYSHIYLFLYTTTTTKKHFSIFHTQQLKIISKIYEHPVFRIVSSSLLQMRKKRKTFKCICMVCILNHSSNSAATRHAATEHRKTDARVAPVQHPPLRRCATGTGGDRSRAGLLQPPGDAGSTSADAGGHQVRLVVVRIDADEYRERRRHVHGAARQQRIRYDATEYRLAAGVGRPTDGGRSALGELLASQHGRRFVALALGLMRMRGL